MWVRMPVWGRLQGTERRCQGWGAQEAEMMSTNTLVSHSDGAKPNRQSSSKEAYVIAEHREMGVKLHMLSLQAWGSVVHPLLLQGDKCSLCSWRDHFPKEATCDHRMPSWVTHLLSRGQPLALAKTGVASLCLPLSA